MDGGITISRPVTLTRRLATVRDDGCASRVVTLCWTLLKGRPWEFLARAKGPAETRIMYLKFFGNGINSLDGVALESEHGVDTLLKRSDETRFGRRLDGNWTYVETLEVLAIYRKCLVVKVDELLCDGVDVCHGRY